MYATASDQDATAVSPEDEEPSRTAFASARVGSACSIIDSSICRPPCTGFPGVEHAEDDPLLEERSQSMPISTPRSPGVRVGLRQGSSSSTASAFSIFGDAAVEQRCSIRRAQVANVAHERQRDVVDAERQREVRRCIQHSNGERANPGG